MSCLFRDLLKILNKKRLNMYIDTMSYVKLLSDFYNQANIVYIDSRGVIAEKN